MPESFPVGKIGLSEGPLIPFPLSMANRHGLVAGATGTGKTVTLRVLAEAFSSAGVPVFMADVKGDLSGLAAPGTMTPKFAERLQKLGFPAPEPTAFPVVFWDVFGEQGHPVRASVSQMGPLILARLLGLNETQEGVLQIAFHAADEAGLLLLDLDDLRAVLRYAAENAREISQQYGNVTTASIGAIQRAILALEKQGGAHFFGEPSMELDDLLKTDSDGRGLIHILAADKLMANPKGYAAMLLWMLSELFENLPEVGDVEKPRLVFFFDEAHLLFSDIPKVVEEKIEQVVRLIRSKGVGIYFVSQNPLDIPEQVLGQLGNRIQHALRAFTPRDQKAVRTAAETFRQNPDIDTAKAILELGIGEALVSLLDSDGQPSVVERVYIVPPASQLPPLSQTERACVYQASPYAGKYETLINRESAFEMLAAKAAQTARTTPTKAASSAGGMAELLFGSVGPRGGKKPGLVDKMASSAVRTVGNSLGRELIRGVLGSLFKSGSR